jgi:hypothetical protein
MDYVELYEKTYSESGSAAIRREQQWESQDVQRTLKRESLRFYEQQTWDKLSEINAERRKLAWKRQEQMWRDQDTIRLMIRLQKRKEHSLGCVSRLGSAPLDGCVRLDRQGSIPETVILPCQPVRCEEIIC